jgi:glutamine cyclotransferase
MPGPITEGWGMTSFVDTTGKQMLLVSDGTNRLFHVDPDGFKISKVVNMFDFEGMPLD